MTHPDKAKNGEGGIRTLGTGYYPYDGLANRCLQPLGHLSKLVIKTVIYLWIGRIASTFSLNPKFFRKKGHFYPFWPDLIH